VTDPTDPALAWLLDAEQSDPAIRWQALRDLAGAPPDVWRAERARVETEGWGARLLALQDPEGSWAGGAHFPDDYVWGGDEPGQPWTATTFSLSLLREMGLDPDSERVRDLVERVRTGVRWEHDGQPYWEGEVEPCINGITVANGAYLGVDVAPIVERLVTERLDDGGWNCDVERGSVRSSFDTTINVLEGLLEFERATDGTEASRVARRSGEEYLLERSLFRRRSTGEVADERYLQLVNPSRWWHHVLRGLDHLRAASVLTGAPPDPRAEEAVDHVRSRRLPDGRWPLDVSPRGRVWFEVGDGPGEPSRWVTLKALRVLRWWDGAA
jgi:hypothetical protein